MKIELNVSTFLDGKFFEKGEVNLSQSEMIELKKIKLGYGLKAFKQISELSEDKEILEVKKVDVKEVKVEEVVKPETKVVTASVKAPVKKEVVKTPVKKVEAKKVTTAVKK